MNKPVEEYLELLSEKNKIKKAIERKEERETGPVKAKEEGFNIYLSGAN